MREICERQKKHFTFYWAKSENSNFFDLNVRKESFPCVSVGVCMWSRRVGVCRKRKLRNLSSHWICVWFLRCQQWILCSLVSQSRCLKPKPKLKPNSKHRDLHPGWIFETFQLIWGFFGSMCFVCARNTSNGLFSSKNRKEPCHRWPDSCQHI